MCCFSFIIFCKWKNMWKSGNQLGVVVVMFVALLRLFCFEIRLEMRFCVLLVNEECGLLLRYAPRNDGNRMIVALLVGYLHSGFASGRHGVLGFIRFIRFSFIGFIYFIGFIGLLHPLFPKEILIIIFIIISAKIINIISTYLYV